MAMLYFLKKKKDVPTIIYASVVVVDMLISILVFPIGVSIFDSRQLVFFHSQVFCDVWAFVWTTLSRMSVFLVGLLSVSRAYSLTFPFHNVKKSMVIGIILLATTVNLLLTSIPFWWQDRHIYHPAIACCASFTDVNMPPEAVVATKAFDYVAIFCPVPVIVVSFVITTWQLAKKTGAGGGKGDGCKHSISVTIALFTGQFCTKKAYLGSNEINLNL